MRSRAAILPFPGDPFLLHYWLHFFDTVWGDEVDKLYIYMNSSVEPAVVDYIRELCAARPKINLQYEDHMTDHGIGIDKSLDICTEELVMLVEDDGFIFKPGIVDQCFKFLESGQYEIVGSKRGSCSMEILTQAQTMWNLAYDGEGDQGPNFWPCYFFSSKELLLKTDRQFCARAWQHNEVIEPLGHYHVQGEIANGDTFVNTSLQLRAMVAPDKILCLPQYHGSPDDLEHFDGQKYLFDGKAPWTHIGSLSSGISGVLQDPEGRPLARRMVEESRGGVKLPPEWAASEAQKREWERRVQWWLTFYQKRDIGKIEEFSDLYYSAILQLIQEFGLNRKNIAKRQQAYATLGL